MKMIHCADLHLDSKLNTHLTGEKRKERRAEIINSFWRMIQYGENHHVEAILIAGDLFDTSFVSETVIRSVRQMIMDHPHICFYYLRGNHDHAELFPGTEQVPDNLKLFGDSWQYYTQPGQKGSVVIAGAELTYKNQESLFDTLYLHPDGVNIVMLHGQEAEYKGQDKTVRIPLRQLKNKGIDYLALGHIHTYKKGELDARGIWCYPGCLEGRGFDECGEHGFILLDVDEETGICETEFIPFSSRNLYTVQIDVSGCVCTEEAGNLIECMLEETSWDCSHMIKIVLTGKLGPDTEWNPYLLKKRLDDRFYYVKIQDETKIEIDYGNYMDDETLTGEFVRIVSAALEIPEEEKPVMIRYGLQALAGEEMD
ncbi:MAG: DNA repair exonuclease [Lachnospiraceae bacterium]|nr:DNA repair exonuclease [Lachnospiraceae bacterium]